MSIASSRSNSRRLLLYSMAILLRGQVWYHSIKDVPYVFKTKFGDLQRRKNILRTVSILSWHETNHIISDIIHQLLHNVNINRLQAVLTPVFCAQRNGDIRRHARWSLLAAVITDSMAVHAFLQLVKFLLYQNWPQPLSQFTMKYRSTQAVQ